MSSDRDVEKRSFPWMIRDFVPKIEPKQQTLRPLRHDLSATSGARLWFIQNILSHM